MDKEIYIKDILKCTNGKLIVGNENDICEEFSKDTRIIKENDTYIGIKGENFDGNKFWKDALDKGAKTVIVENTEFSKKDIESYKNKNIILVENTLEALYKIAKYKRSLYNIPVIAITGSVGKTSTKDIIANVVGQKYKTLKTEGNNNNNIGLPLTILKLKNHEALVIEMGMNHFGEISLLTNIAKPTISVITNIGTSHIGNLGSRENILKAKLEILEGMENPILVINNDNDLLSDWNNSKKDSNIKTYTYGIENNSDIMAKNINIKDDGSEFDCESKKEKIHINVPVSGNHFVYNAMCATLIGKILNIENDKIQKGIKEFELTKKRMDVLKIENNITIINDSYNASYESMKASIEYLSKINGKRKIAVLGDMFELGKYSEELHKKVGEEIVKNNIDVLICCGNNSKYIIEKATELGMNINNVYYLNNIDEVVEKLKQILKEDDFILVKASNGMKFFNIIEKLQNNT
jgi:UDP-N-acetylmuramoyl-tripeptide--D-alanyl-D-alanine ligase